MKSSKGITLIALVVTIIVLVILAGVSVNLLISENGIIAKSKQAKKDYELSSEDEKAALVELEDDIEAILENKSRVRYKTYYTKNGDEITLSVFAEVGDVTAEKIANGQWINLTPQEEEELVTTQAKLVSKDINETHKYNGKDFTTIEEFKTLANAVASYLGVTIDQNLNTVYDIIKDMYWPCCSSVWRP